MFLEAPHESHRHEAKLLEEYAGDIDTRSIFRETHSPYPYYICALTWYMFEQYFREQRIDNKYRTYKSHLYLIFRYSLGEFPPRLTRSRAVDSYCNKMLHLLKEPQFETQVQKTLELFDATQKMWLDRGKSRFGIKDSKDFTDLLIEQARNNFIPTSTPVAEDVGENIYEGTILNILLRHGLWFGFIKRGGFKENVYFDSRGYKGDKNKLSPNKKVRHELCKGSRGEFARNVEILD